MKQNHLLYSAFITLLLPFGGAHATNLPSETELKAEAITIVKQFGGTLKPKLQQGIKQGGFEHAIKVCAIEAPKIAKELSNQTGWTVKRVSLKPRNSSAAPDEFERKVLESFNTQLAAGASISTLHYAETVGDEYRFMKPQPVEAVCLGCHGKAISEGVKTLITEHYPEDTATGYSLGEIRGAFSLVKKL
ncbi:Tll0287-like domain-containing protein [Thalassotalea piscium]|uniref:Tll0287-like domain-containing protein n=1 Tax=Thalassotalea piscium TaxID=1230533 RepID=A0A7X0NIB4_9GAMM|nr:DUF3365 domain-containing protein [Thalassotalea piscium]MBB6543831.1 hypothetical protein [Thalassotalea piscium]